MKNIHDFFPGPPLEIIGELKGRGIEVKNKDSKTLIFGFVAIIALGVFCYYQYEEKDEVHKSN